VDCPSVLLRRRPGFKVFAIRIFLIWFSSIFVFKTEISFIFKNYILNLNTFLYSSLSLFSSQTNKFWNR